MRYSWMMALALVACDKTTDTHDPNTSDVDYTMPDLPSGLVADEGCNGANDSDGNYHDIAGATTYWVGNFAFNAEGDVEGTERWVQYANPTWIAEEEDLPGEVCVITWDAFGVKGDPVACGTCDYSLTIDAYINRADSDCPDGLWADEENYSVVYDVRVVGDQSTFYFASSGNELAVGDASDDTASYVTEGACKWY
ncbi:MAG: hypothetical protein JXX28_10600 [Deltaproteobacteria bacterium]|nr:hypothetical protein [Deltaproteobacteria bacterium]